MSDLIFAAAILFGPGTFVLLCLIPCRKWLLKSGRITLVVITLGIASLGLSYLALSLWWKYGWVGEAGYIAWILYFLSIPVTFSVMAGIGAVAAMCAASQALGVASEAGRAPKI